MTFNFTDKGRKAFQAITRHVAERGADNAFGGDPVQTSQHFAIALDNELVSAPYINWQRELRRHRRRHRRADLRLVHDQVRAGPRDDPQDRRPAAEAQRGLAFAGLRDARQAGPRPGPEGRHRRLRHRRAVPDRLLPRARRHRRARDVHLRAVLLRARQAHPDHADAAGHRGSDPDARRRGRREHRRLRTRERGGAGRKIGRHGDRHRLPQGPDGDHRREHRHVPRRVHPLHPRDLGRPGLRLHPRSRRHRVAVHRGARDAGDPVLAARHAPDPAPGPRSAPASSGVKFQIDYMGKAKWFFSASGCILLDLRPGDVGQRHQLRHRLRRRHADHRAAGAGRDGRSGARDALPARPRRREDPDADEPRARQPRRPDLHRGAPEGGVDAVNQALDRAFGQPERRTSSRSARASARPSRTPRSIAIIASLLDHLDLHRAALRAEVRRAGADRADARHPDRGGRLRSRWPGGDDVDGRGAPDHLGLLVVRHDHRVRPNPREHPANAERGVLADRQPLAVRRSSSARSRRASARCCRCWR